MPKTLSIQDGYVSTMIDMCSYKCQLDCYGKYPLVRMENRFYLKRISGILIF